MAGYQDHNTPPVVEAGAGDERKSAQKGFFENNNRGYQAAPQELPGNQVHELGS